MPGINAMIAKLNSVDLNEIIADSIEETKLDLNKVQKEQLLHGEGKNGRIGRYRNHKYAEAKHRLNPLAGLGNVDLKLKGDYYKGVFVDVRSGSVVIESGDNKTAKLTEKYGENISGLNPDYAAGYSNDYLAPQAIDRIKKKIV
jgi:hypothetical protein